MNYIIAGICVFGMVVYVNKKEGKDYNPWIYAIGGVVFGLIFGIAMFLAKFYKDSNPNNVVSIICYIIAGLMVLINILVILGVIVL